MRFSGLWICIFSVVLTLSFADEIVTEWETVSSTSTSTIYTCGKCTSTTSSSVVISQVTVTQQVSVPTTVVVTTTAECMPKRKRIVSVTKTVCTKCYGQVVYTTAPESLASIYKEMVVTMKPCVRCDNSPNCTEPIQVSNGDVPPCRICCSLPTKPVLSTA